LSSSILILDKQQTPEASVYINTLILETIRNTKTKHDT